MQTTKVEPSWQKQELTTADLGDKRLNRRLGDILESLGGKPSLSIPSACKGWAETKAAYRFISNKRVTAQKVLKPHYEATLERMRLEKIVLLPQDTTELDYTGKSDIEGLGYIAQHKKRRGFYLHPTLAVTPERVCLGVVDANMWARKEFGIKKDRNNKRIEEKESFRWLESFRIAEKIADELPETKIVSIADREGDIYEFFMETAGVRAGSGAHWLIRSTQDRCTLKGDNKAQAKLWETVQNAAVVGTVEFDMPAGRGRKARHVRQEVRMAEVKLKGVRRKGKTLASLKVNAVLALEVGVPAGEEAVEWLLLTSCPVADGVQALEIIQWYLCRWQIEIFFKVLKVGCEVEELQLESLKRLEICIALYMMVAWRILFVTMQGRQYPDLPCDRLFEESEWKAVYMVIHKEKPPGEPPSLDKMVRMIATLGGFLDRKGDGYPGVQTIWIGMQRMRDFTYSWEAFQVVHGKQTCG